MYPEQKNAIKALLLTGAIFLIVCLLAILLFVAWFFTATPPVQKNITWGINFSKTQVESLKLDWKSAYLAAMEDLGAKNIKLLTDWNTVEPSPGDYNFTDTDWQISQAENHGVSIIYVVGMKTGRWPECHVPPWADSMTLNKEQQQARILTYIKEVVNRYKMSPNIIAWQAENEPFVAFGECTWQDEEFLKKEVALIKSLDPSRPVIISDSGETSSWFDAAKIGDLVGITLYRKVWVSDSAEYRDANTTSGHYETYAFKPSFYWRKAQIIHFLFGKKVISGELQAEPWSFKSYQEVEISEQEKTMNLQQFKENIEYAKNTGLDTFYLWGAEWWFWLKETQGKPEMWNGARNLFNNGNI